jgi:hypothetical protein
MLNRAPPPRSRRRRATNEPRNWSVTSLKEEYCDVGSLPAAIDWTLSRRDVPGGQDLPLAALTGRFVHSDRNAVYKQDSSSNQVPRGAGPGFQLRSTGSHT